MKTKDILLALFVAFAWGSYFTVSKIALVSFPPLFLAFLRFFFLFCLTSPFLFRAKLPLRQVLCLSIVTTINLLVLNHAIYLSHAIAPIILINELGVPISVVLGIYFFKENFFFKDVLGILISLIGLVIVVYTRNSEKVNLLAVVLTIIASFLFAFYNVLAKNLSKYNILSLLAYLSLFIFPQFLCLSFLQEEWPELKTLELKSIYALLYIVVICSLFSHYIWLYLFNKYNLSKIVPFTLLCPFFGCLTTAFILDEHIKNSVIFGGFLVILGIAILELKKKNVN